MNPTPAQLQAAGLVAITEVNGYPLRSWDAKDGKFPPETAYISAKWDVPPTPAPPTPVPVPTPTPTPAGPTPLAPVAVGALLLNEDFSTQTSLNTKIWTPDWFTPTSKQNGVTTDPKNVSLVNGQLVLTLASATDGAAVSSNPDDGVSGHTGFQFTYGYVEASVSFPSVSGKLVNWPAFWTNGQNWPATEEFDIAEVLGGNMTTNYHSAALPNGGNSGTIPGTWTGKHVYSELWTSGKQTVYFDGVEVFSRSCNATGAPQYLIFTHGVSGSPAIGAKLLIDYVRVWELA